jgi:hypothetical protein
MTAAILSAGAIMLCLMTQDTRGLMVMSDQWTIVIGAIFGGIQVFLRIAQKNNAEKAPEISV